jgi:hypothetical protein
VAAILETWWEVAIALAATSATMLLLPFGFKWLAKKLFHKEVSYFVSFLIVLATLMVWSGVSNYFDPPR